MKQFSGFEAKQSVNGRAILPAGGYVCDIKSAKVEEYQDGKFSSLVLAIDVSEGEHAGFFKRDYESNDREDKRWRGRYAISIPKDDGSEQDTWTKRTFGNFIWAVQESNPGYTWNWDEKSLKGKKVGVLFRNKEWEMNGKTGWTTEAGGSTTIDKIRDGSFSPLKDKPLKNRPSAPATDASGFTELEDEDDLPF